MVGERTTVESWIVTQGASDDALTQSLQIIEASRRSNVRKSCRGWSHAGHKDKSQDKGIADFIAKVNP